MSKHLHKINNSLCFPQELQVTLCCLTLDLSNIFFYKKFYNDKNKLKMA